MTSDPVGAPGEIVALLNSSLTVFLLFCWFSDFKWICSALLFCFKPVAHGGLFQTSVSVNSALSQHAPHPLCVLDHFQSLRSNLHQLNPLYHFSRCHNHFSTLADHTVCVAPRRKTSSAVFREVDGLGHTRGSVWCILWSRTTKWEASCRTSAVWTWWTGASLPARSRSPGHHDEFQSCTQITPPVITLTWHKGKFYKNRLPMLAVPLKVTNSASPPCDTCKYDIYFHIWIRSFHFVTRLSLPVKTMQKSTWISYPKRMWHSL